MIPMLAPPKSNRIRRPIRVEGELAFIPLSQSLEAVIDAADVPIVEGYNWHAVLNRNVYYARACGARGAASGRRMVPLHRLLLRPPEGVFVDHKDGNGLNCRRANMRLATASENTHNQRRSRHNTSGRKGVSWDSGHNKWSALITIGRRRIKLGFFADIELAAAAYAEAARKYHGEFANFGHRDASAAELTPALENGPAGLADAHSKNPPEAEHG
ncbi:AP2 domain-containing protein [Bosea sp. AK1]|uniref:HNH endonuclease n=1 Tax=Bosea sp. AK1 TaxID=2587160 RepID=UPI0011534540|nr:HNH endonuclease [Bosea sp. AK1]TQI72859.1 AP2 domain-containing protein [Bosea sp. AK1]